MRGTSIYVNVFDDRVEIGNPGGIPAGLSPKDFGKASVRRNIIIADLFHRMGKVERIGSGIKRMRDLMAEAGLRRPGFETTSFFRAVFFRNPEYALKQAEGENSREKLGEKLELSDISCWFLWPTSVV
jgi:ATP-dependent DNA helicase RecG